MRAKRSSPITEHIFKRIVRPLLVTTFALASLLPCLPTSVLAESGGAPTWTYVGKRATLYEIPRNQPLYREVQATRSYGDTELLVDYQGYETDIISEEEDLLAFTCEYRWSSPPSSIAVGHEEELLLHGTLELSHSSHMLSPFHHYSESCVAKGTMLAELFLFGYERALPVTTDDRYALIYDLAYSPSEVAEEGRTDFPPAYSIGWGYSMGVCSVSASNTFSEAPFSISDPALYDRTAAIAQGLDAVDPWTPLSAIPPENRGYFLVIVLSMESAGFQMEYFYSYEPSDATSSGTVPPTHVVVDTDAPQDPGESLGPVIPAAIVAGTVAVAGGAAAAIVRGRRKRAPKGGDEDTGDDVQRSPSSYRMVLFKEFGDTILVGGEPRLVGARIEEVGPDGRPIDRPDLTGRIQIALSENLTNDGAKMCGRYMATHVGADGRDEEGGGEAIICFSFTGPGGSLRNNVHFKVRNGCGLVFAQEALTFIAGAGQRLQMPFGIEGVDLSSGIEPRFELSISTSNASDFTDLRVTRDAEHPDILWNVEMRECGKPDTLPAGYMESYSCQVTAAIPGARGDRIIRGSYEFYRFHEGIRFSCQHLKAYYVRKGAPESPQLASGTGDGTAQGDSPEPAVVELTPARTKATVTFYSWDAENGKLINPIPDVKEIRLSFADVPGSERFWGKDGNRLDRPCEALDFRYFISDIEGVDNTLHYDILPVNGVMQPPNRSQADVTVSLTWEGKPYQATERVNVISQPYRTDLDGRRAEYREQDRHREERLTYIKRKILDDPVYGDMMPVCYLIDAMLDGYAPEFGYFEPDWLRVRSLFIRYTTGEIGSIEANDLAFYGRALEYSDAFKMTVQGFTKSIPLAVLRIGCAIKTGGASEAFFLPLAAIAKGTESSLDYVDKGGDSLLEAYRVGASSASKAALADYLTGKAIEGVFALAAAAARAAAKGALVLAGKAKVAKDALTMRLKGLSSTGKGAGALKSAATNVGKQLDDAAIAARKAIDANRDLVLGSAELTKRDIAYTLGRINGRLKYLDELKALKRWDKLSRFEQQKIVLAVQSDKHAMRALMEADDPLAHLVRANHSKVMAAMEGKALHMARVSLSDELKVPLSKIRVKTTSGNLAADIRAGKGLSMDMDASFEVEIDGTWVYVKESLGQRHFDKAFFKISRGYDAVDDIAAAMHSKAHDLSIVDAAGKQSYGTYEDALRIIKAERAGEVFDDVQRVVKTVDYKNEEWLELARTARADAKAALVQGRAREAQWLSEAAESFVEEGCRSFTKQTNRAVVNKLIALEKSGVKVDAGNFLAKAKVIEQSGIGKNRGAGLTTAEVEITLENGFNATLEDVFGELGPMIKKLNRLLEGGTR
ncbi:hypothetical protein EII22_04535 [Coriobacteriales bacterium OH1046]|nr:hypothetical protein EII22_04535 [Coriobacteriales bacterium OH1046]